MTALIPWRPLVALLVLAGLLCGCGREERARRQAAAAESYFRSGDYDRAEIGYRNLLKDRPGDVLACERLGTIWLERGEPLQAARWLAKAKGLDPGNLGVRVRLAKALHALGAHPDAREELRLVLKVSPDHGQALLAFAETSESAEELAEAKRSLDALSEAPQPPVLLAAALVAIRQGDTAGGEAAVRRACSLDPGDAAARALSASLRLSAGDLEDAEREFRQAAELASPRSPEGLKLAAFLLQTGRREEALSLLAETTAKAPDFLPAWRMQARVALAEQRLDDAARLLERVFSRAPEDLEAGLMQTEIWLAKGEGDKAVALMKRLREVFPDRPGIEFHLARAYLSVANRILADEALERALLLDPSYPEAALLRARLKLGAGEAVQAAEALDAYLADHPDDLQAQLLLIDAYHAAGRFAEADAALEKSVASRGDDYRPHLLIGMNLRAKGDAAGARAAFEEAARLAPDNLLVTLHLAALDIAEQDLPAAERRVAGQLGRHPASAGAHYLSAAVADRKQDMAGAEQALLRAIELEPDFLAAYGLLIRVYVQAGKTEAAAEQLRKFIAANPDSIPALMQLGTIHQENGRHEEARDCYERIIRLDPAFAPALNNLAILLSEVLGEPETAYEIATQARTLLPGEGAVADTLGWIVLGRGDYRRAFALLQEAARALPDDPSVQYHLGVAAAKTGRAALALSALERAAADEKAPASAVTALERVRKAAGMDAGELRLLLKEDPEDLLALLGLATLHLHAGEHQAAASACERALAVNPDLQKALLYLAELHAGPLEDPDKALDFAKRLRQLAPTDPRAAAALGRAAYAAGQHDWALTLFQEAAAGLPEDAEIRRDLARAEDAADREDKIKDDARAVTPAAAAE